MNTDMRWNRWLVRRLAGRVLWLWPAMLAAGCFPGVPETSHPSVHLHEPRTQRNYTLYAPSYYTADRRWPLVIPLHGTYGFDGPDWQVTAWKDVAEEHGLIVAAPALDSVQGILPVDETLRLRDLQNDEKAILAVLDDVASRYNIDRQAVLLTGFSAGGYPLYYVGLRNPTRFQMLIAGGANAKQELFDQIIIPAEAKKLPIAIFFGKSDNQIIQDQSWLAYRWLRSDRNQLYQTKIKKVPGGHLRMPSVSYELWSKYLPKDLKQ